MQLPLLPSPKWHICDSSSCEIIPIYHGVTASDCRTIPSDHWPYCPEAPWEKAIRLKRACRCEESERIKIEQKGSGNLAQVVCDCSRSQLLELTNNNSTAVIVFFEPIQTYSNVLLYHASIFQIIKTGGLPLFRSDELSTDVSRRSRNCQRTQ